MSTSRLGFTMGIQSSSWTCRVEVTHADTPIANVDGETQDVKDRCSQLYSILTGLLRGKPLRVLRQVDGRNGYEAWRQLSQMYLPKTKSRAI
jgi:DNA primase